MGNESVEITEFEPGDADGRGLRRRAYDEILARSFVPAELMSLEEIAGDCVVLVAMQGDDVVGVAVADREDADSVVLLSYLAAKPGGRGKGLGGHLLRHLIGRWRDRGVAVALGEIHDPRQFADGPDEHPAARLRFYERFGAEVLGPWTQPSLIPGMGRVRGMLLIALHRGGAAAAGPVPSEMLRDWIGLYYEVSEGRPPADPEALELLGRYADPLGVQPLALGDFESVAPLPAPGS